LSNPFGAKWESHPFKQELFSKRAAPSIPKLVSNPLPPKDESMTVVLTKFYAHSTKPALVIGQMPYDRMAFRGFMQSLPDHCTGRFKASTRIGVSNCLTIFGAENVKVFKVFFANDFSAQTVYPTDNTRAFCKQFWAEDEDGETYHFRTRKNLDYLIRECPSHPYNVMGRRIHWKRYVDQVDANSRMFLAPEVGRVVKDRQDRAAAAQHFMETIEGLRHGDYVEIEFSDRKNPISVQDHEQYLFGGVWVFDFAVDMLADVPNAILVDGTFTCLRPWCAIVVSAVFSNEACPIACGWAPTETGRAMVNLYGAILKALEMRKLPASLLTDIPLVSDQGAALGYLANKFHLKWHHCHFHLLRTVGAKTMLGAFVRRLLHCYTAEQYLEERDQIRLEMDVYYQKHPKPDRLDILKQMLDGKGIEHWALWLRSFSPSTTASEESINAQLNAKKGLARAFGKALAILLDYCRHRWSTRNSHRRRQNRASNLFLQKCHAQTPQGEKLRNNQGKFDFLQHVNSFRRDPLQPPEMNWQFPVHPDPQPFPSAKYVDGSEEFPASWHKSRSHNRPVAPAASSEVSEAAEPTTNEIDYHELLCRTVLGEIRNMMSKKKWQTHRKPIMGQARTRLGEIVTTPRSQKVNPQETMIFRLQCYEDAHVA
jgi:hypothetical protein